MRWPSSPGGNADSAPGLPSPAQLRWHDLGLRAASAVVLAPIGLYAIWRGGGVWIAMLLILGGGAMWEWSQLSSRLADGHGRNGASVFVLLAGFAYVALAALSLGWLRGNPEAGFADVLFVILTVWASDIGAYLIGRLFGGPRLAPAISPGKTWSGTLGGLAASVGTALAAAALLSPGSAGRAALVGAMVSVAAQAGDLLESWVKRRAGVKNSGSLLPGHGGLLDRLDGLLAAAPVAAGLALGAGPGVVLWR